MDTSRSIVTAWLTIVGAAALVVGPFLAWATATSPILGRTTIDGTETIGRFGVLAGIIIGIIWVRAGMESLGGDTQATIIGRYARPATIVVAGLAALGTINVITNINDIAERAEASSLINVTIGAGPWITLAGATSAAIGAIWSPRHV